MKKLKVIWGAPCSGKTTYCQKNLKEKDVVFDFDWMKNALIYGNDHEKFDWVQDLVLSLRGAFLRNVKDNKNIGQPYFIVTWLTQNMRDFIEEEIGLEAEYIRMNTTMEECLKRLEKDDSRPDKESEEKGIREWFDTFGKEEEKDKTMERKMDTRQYRSLLANLEPAKENKRIDTEYYVEGYAATFDRYELWEEDGEKIYEQFMPTSFIGTDMTDVILQFDHRGKVFARQSNGSLIVEVDDKGLFIAADLSRSVGAKELYEEIQNGLITKMSWGFRLGEYEFDKTTNTIVHKNIKKIYDVSAVSIPANDGTIINARSLVDGVIEQSMKERHARDKLALKIKLELKGE